MAAIKDEILATVFKPNGVGCTTVDGIMSTTTKVLTRTERFQERVRRHIEDNYIDFLPNHTSPDLFLEESDSLEREINELLATVGQEGQNALSEANTKLTTCGLNLREILLGLRVSQHVLKIDDLFQCVEEAKATKDYLTVLDLVGKLRNLIYCEDGATPQGVERIFYKLDCYDTVKVKYHVQVHLLQQNLQERFDRLVQLNCKSFPTSRCVTLQLSKNLTQLQDIVLALFQPHYNPAKLCEFLFDNCIEPLILKPVSVEYDENAEGGTYVQLSLSYSTKESSSGQLLRPSYTQVFEHFKQLLQTLSSINISVSSTQHVFSLIGDHFKDRMLELLVSECLVPAVPETMEDYQTSTLREDVVQFEQFLADTFLIDPEKDNALTKFTEQYETFYRNRLYKRVLEMAREIMQRDLQDMTLLEERTVVGGVTGDPFLFPRCMVSKSTMDFVKLMERIVRSPSRKGINSDVKDDTEVPSNPLAGAISVMLNAYVVEVPKIHKKLLESIPQQSVLLYNNCYFLAHWVSNNAKKGIECFAALVKMLHTTGNKYFKVQVNYQESILMDIMSGLVFENPHTLGTTPLKLVRQCLRQLELLKNVWQNVLPDNVYNSTFCDLLHTFISELVRRIFTLRDISATMASELSDLIDVVLEKAPQLFKEHHEVVHVRSWMKLQQLKTLMNASLKEITELWCDGAGPLTASFKADEIKHLIRALFQDSDRRAKAINQII